MLLTGCDEKRPEPIQLNKDNCAYCKMTISDPRFGAQLITGKVRLYKFDDLSCLKTWEEENQPENPRHYVANYLNTEQFLAVEEAVYVSGPKVNSPMGGNLAAFSRRDDAVAYATRIEGEVVDWEAIGK